MQSWRRWSHALFGGALLLVLGWAPAAAQSIKGTVTDSANQRPLQGALVSVVGTNKRAMTCLLYSSPSPRDRTSSRTPSSA